MISFSPPLLLAFILAASLLTLTPGVDTAMVLRACATGGKRPARAAAFGIALGCLLWGAAVALGLGALLRASPLAYDVVKYAGAAYLLVMGVKLLRHPRQLLGQGQDLHGQAFRRGLFTNLLNPKVGVFYVSFLPQFIPAGAALGADILCLVLIHVALSLVWFTVLIEAAARVRRGLQRPGVIAWLDRVAGGVFILFGFKLAFSKL